MEVVEPPSHIKYTISHFSPRRTRLTRLRIKKLVFFQFEESHHHLLSFVLHTISVLCVMTPNRNTIMNTHPHTPKPKLPQMEICRVSGENYDRMDLVVISPSCEDDESFIEVSPVSTSCSPPISGDHHFFHSPTTEVEVLEHRYLKQMPGMLTMSENKPPILLQRKTYKDSDEHESIEDAHFPPEYVTLEIPTDFTRPPLAPNASPPSRQGDKSRPFLSMHTHRAKPPARKSPQIVMTTINNSWKASETAKYVLNDSFYTEETVALSEYDDFVDGDIFTKKDDDHSHSHETAPPSKRLESDNINGRLGGMSFLSAYV